MVWIDVETFGLNPTTDPILELGLIVTDRHGIERARYQRVIGGTASGKRLARLDAESEFIRNMHTKNGLFDEVRQACKDVEDDPYESEFRRANVERDALEFLASHFTNLDRTLPMAGASVQFDRGVLLQQMPALHNWFHYRQHDVSTIIGLMTFAGIQPDPRVAKRNTHRSIPDCEDEISVHAWGMNILKRACELDTEMEFINTELRRIGIHDPIGARGVRSLSAFYEVTRNELVDLQGKMKEPGDKILAAEWTQGQGGE